MGKEETYINRAELEGYLFGCLISNGLHAKQVKNIVDGLDMLENITVDKKLAERMEDDLK